jgi:uncharacterized protein (DUF1330 family)
MIDITDAELDRLLAEDPGGPVVMLNLLRFDPEGGRERYAEYLAGNAAMSDNVAELVYMGFGGRALVAEEGQAWDAVALVRYPSRQAFVDTIRSPEYQAIKPVRRSALIEAVLQPMVSALRDDE